MGNLEKYIDVFLAEGWDEPSEWTDLTAEDLREDIKMPKGHIRRFERRFEEWRQKQQKENTTKGVSEDAADEGTSKKRRRSESDIEEATPKRKKARIELEHSIDDSDESEFVP